MNTEQQRYVSQVPYHVRARYKTRGIIILVLALIAILALLAEVILVVAGHQTSDAMIAIISTCVGGIAGMALPGKEEDNDDF